MRTRVTFVFSLLALLLTGASALGCTYNHRTRDVTSWLRTNGWHNLEIIAESGGSHDQYSVERKVDGHWQTLENSSDRAFAFSGGTRAVLNSDLLFPDGRTVRLNCQGEIRADPKGKELYCLEFDQWSDHEMRSFAVKRIDRDGKLIQERRLPHMVPVPAEGTRTSLRNFFLGFSPAGLVFAVRITSPGPDDHPERSEHKLVDICSGFVLGAEDRWVPQKSVASEKCEDAEVWSNAIGFPIDKGIEMVDTDGR